ncbi:ABC transporter permease [Fuchsiella alkaliacetigena]|uniref:ABC transporter permease n=1 Tax=Fuchsiella alkaliacetigena TaxID=957042 RepID=UPI00200A9FBB|nr:ABC transporter permease subunit [Fuchsiella alkaliacetigena]MCK8823841.1 ABC transporter permease subunit [Fuchsiella alkaliacetigena]
MKLVNSSFWKPYLLLLPALIILVGLFLGGVALAIMQSLGYFPLLGLEEFTFDYFREIFADPHFLTSLGYSLYISLVSAVISVIVGVFFAFQLMRLADRYRVINILYKLPIIVPHIVVALLIFLLFTQSGFWARLAYRLGWIEEMSQFPALIFDRRGIGIIFAYLWKQIPFVTLIVYTIFKNINQRWEQVALNLGASKIQVFWNIYLPLAMPGIASAFIIIFAFSFGAFEIPLLLGPSYPRTLPVLAYQRYASSDLSQRPYAMAITVVISLISILLILIYKKIMDYYQLKK